MKKQTVYFLQALYTAPVDKNKVVQTGILYAKDEMQRNLQGFLHPRTLLISDYAKQLKRKAQSLLGQLDMVQNPQGLLPLVDEYERLIGEVAYCQKLTIRALDNPAGSQRSDLHIIARQMIPFAAKSIRTRCILSTLRCEILRGRTNFRREPFPENDSLHDWLDYYFRVIGPETDTMPDDIADGRWAYELHTVRFRPYLTIPQFVMKQPATDRDLWIAPGQARVGSGAGGVLRITGRGCLTNLLPSDEKCLVSGEYVSSLAQIRKFQAIDRSDKKYSENPNQCLERLLGRKYLIHAEEYFQMMNRYLVTHTLGIRLQEGSCMYCGSLMSKGVCQKCVGGTWAK
ncbi:MAG: hypothetical protein IJV58_02370 [Oscillospiraceae bacterium]|nr:hypothetical protein [Oscillospiraceae bacterium]MBR1458123.1 hypothetical protein [Oscillospiraceae bacterium]